MNIRLYSLFSFNYLKDYQFHNFTPTTHELIYLLNGEGLITTNNKTYFYHPHSICFTPMLDTKDLRCLKHTNYICIRFTGDISDLKLNSGVYPAESEEFYHLFLNISDENKNKSYRYYDYCNLIIQQILIRLTRIQFAKTNEISPIYKLVQQIDSNPCFSMNIQDMAAFTGYSYDHFRHKFKQITGISPAEYVMNKRIDHACTLLSEKKMSCSEISEFCGFSSPSQFSVLFKKKTGISPKQYLSYIFSTSDNLK